MSVLIKGMEMLKTGVYTLSVDNTGVGEAIFTVATHTNSGKIILHHVGKAVLVPPHGRLIDADALAAVSAKWLGMINIGHIDDAPTIIPAEEEKENGKM